MADYKDVKYNVDYGDTTGGGGGLTLISTSHIANGASGHSGVASSMDFTSGLDSTYDVYKFVINGMIPDGGQSLHFQVDTGTNTNYNQTVTTMQRAVSHKGDGTAFADDGHGGPQDNDAANAIIGIGQLGDGDDDNQDRGGLSGYLYLFNPASTVFEKHFISKMTGSGMAGTNPYLEMHENAGYFQQTAAITRIRFLYTSTNIRAGRISMYGVAK